MKILFDTNILVDTLTEREPFAANASLLLAHVEKHHIQGYLAATTITTLSYLLSKYGSKHLAWQQLDIILQLFEISEINKFIIQQAHSLQAIDFEDAVLYCAAAHSGCHAIVTRNIKDFKASPIPVYTPDELLVILAIK
ncbi:MAG: PIN domain-containing protein [Acinetobacter populi]|jgi:predicted nucleic acid-binding protein|uniref:type II toxin-antitoxin system VapC family toxin n=1 Tax=Acinetobacter populi TaxID=1582270 RepID=UPI002353E30A|nr:PIN domain-containing protein [Acinetobacter populi]MCH4246404.1 PIN domain-containing protein [Acinetobacter populi]